MARIAQMANLVLPDFLGVSWHHNRFSYPPEPLDGLFSGHNPDLWSTRLPVFHK